MLALLDYPKSEGRHPEFNLALRVNFKSGVAQEQFGFRFVGSEGVMTTSMSGITISKPPKEDEPGYTIGTFPKAVAGGVSAPVPAAVPGAPGEHRGDAPGNHRTLHAAPGA